jgi:antitoxin PrlF
MVKMKKDSECCKVEAIVSVDERGQVVLPKDIRERMDLKKGEKLALSVMEKNGRPCCMVLAKVEFLSKPVGELIGLKGDGK